jgi:hypothetical protein
VSLQGRTTEDSEVAGKGDREFSDGVLHRQRFNGEILML